MDVAADAADFGLVVRLVQHAHDQPCDDLHLVRPHPAGGQRRRAETQAGGDERLLRITRDHVLVGRDVRLLQRALGDLSGQLLGPQIAEHEVGVRPTRHQPQSPLDQPGGERLRVVEDALLVVLEVGLQSLAERDRLGGDDVLERPALDAGEDVRVHGLRVLLLAEDQPGAGTPQGLVRGGGDRVGERHRARVEAHRDHARDVRDVADHQRAHLLGDLAQPDEVQRARVRRSAAEDGARPDFPRQLARGGEIDGLRLRVEPVVVDLEELAREVHRRPVGEMAALRQGK